MRKLLVNGPINVVRMEGEINGIHKVIYLFMDRHDDIDVQTNCGDANSIDIMDFFKRSFDNLNKTDKTYDFYLETFPLYSAVDPDRLPHITESTDKLIYLSRMWKFFNQHTKFNRKRRAIKSYFKNVRFHYIDIRSPLYYFLSEPLKYSKYRLKDRDPAIKYIIPRSIEVMLEFCKRVEDTIRTGECKSTRQNLFKELDRHITEFLLKKQVRRKYFNLFMYSLCKLLNNYHHDNVSKTIKHYVHGALLNRLHNLIDELSLFYRSIADRDEDYYQQDETITKISRRLKELWRNAFAFAARFVDSYFLRRFLDKDYVTNAIVYTGAAHSVAFIYILTKLGFKITNCANCPDKNIKHVEKMVESISDLSEANRLRLLDIFLKPNQIQCVDLTDFPSDFS